MPIQQKEQNQSENFIQSIIEKIYYPMINDKSKPIVKVVGKREEVSQLTFKMTQDKDNQAAIDLINSHRKTGTQAIDQSGQSRLLGLLNRKTNLVQEQKMTSPESSKVSNQKTASNVNLASVKKQEVKEIKIQQPVVPARKINYYIGGNGANDNNQNTKQSKNLDQSNESIVMDVIQKQFEEKQETNSYRQASNFDDQQLGTQEEFKRNATGVTNSTQNEHDKLLVWDKQERREKVDYRNKKVKEDITDQKAKEIAEQRVNREIQAMNEQCNMGISAVKDNKIVTQINPKDNKSEIKESKNDKKNNKTDTKDTKTQIKETKEKDFEQEIRERSKVQTYTQRLGNQQKRNSKMDPTPIKLEHPAPDDQHQRVKDHTQSVVVKVQEQSVVVKENQVLVTKGKRQKQDILLKQQTKIDHIKHKQQALNLEQVKYSDQLVIRIQKNFRGFRLRKTYNAARAKRNRYRFQVVSELVRTENQYVTDLKTITGCLMDPLLEQKIISEKEQRVVFSNIREIIQLNVGFSEALCKLLPFGTWTRIGGTCLQFVHFFRLYFAYVNEFKGSQTQVDALKTKSPQFLAHLKSFERIPQARGMSFDDFMVKPVQRLPKYVLLFQDLLKHTLPSHPDYQDLAKVLEIFKQVNHSNNENLNRVLNGPKLFELNKLYCQGMQLVNGRREYKGEALKSILWENDIKIVCVNYLSDMLLVTREKLLNSGYKKYMLYVALELNENSECVDLPDTQFFSNLIQVIGANSSITFIEESTSTKVQHITMIKLLINKVKDNRENRLEAGKKAGTQMVQFTQQKVNVEVLGTEQRGGQIYYIISIRIEEIAQNAYLRFKDCVEIRDSVRKSFPSLQLQNLNRGFFSFESSDLKSQEASSIQVQNFLSTLLNSPEIQSKPHEVMQQIGIPVNFFLLPQMLRDQLKLQSGSVSNLRLGSRKESLPFESTKASLIEAPKQSRGFSAQKIIQQHMKSTASGKIHSVEPSSRIPNKDKQVQTVQVSTHHNSFDTISLDVGIRACAMDLYPILEHQLNIQSSWDFRLMVMDEGNKCLRALADEEVISSVLEDKSMFKAILSTKDKRLFFKKYVYLDMERELLAYQRDPPKMHLVYNQTVEEIRSGHYIFNFKDYFSIAASFNIAQAQKINDTTIAQIVPAYALKTTSMGNWRQGVLQFTQLLDSVLRELGPSANLEFVRNVLLVQVHRNPLHGSQLFAGEHMQGKQQDKKQLEGPTILGVRYDSFIAINPKTKEQLRRVDLGDILKVKGLAGSLIITISSDEELKFKTSYGYQIQSIIEEYKILQENQDEYSEEHQKKAQQIIQVAGNFLQISSN